MAKHYHVRLLLLSFMILLLRVEVQANSSCQADQIMIKDPITGSIQCQDCLKCPPGEGLSVNCGDVITPSTPVQCKPCVLGETYSASFNTGACEDCANCGVYRETTKACTVTSKARCGRCKPSAYAEGMLGLCRPCSPCCNDGNDIIIPECQVAGVPTGMQCSYLRSDKCSALVTSSTSTTPSTPPPDQSTTPWWPSPSTTSTTETSPSSEPVVILNEDASPNVGLIAGSVVGGLSLVIPILVIAYYKVMRKRWKAFSMRIGVDKVENGAGQAQNREQGNDQEVNRDQTEDRVALPPGDLYQESLLPHPTQEEAGDNSPDKLGVQETKSRPPSCKSSLDSELYGSVKKYTDSSKVQGHSPLSVVSRKTTVTMIEVTDERVTSV
ncbi:tumor necrosis factor receptor superfamily member 16-like [Stylophora pistillata]|nr:tumor necrosis factor receptor superfamily member 16-like [Stylophora pistillata]